MRRIERTGGAIAVVILAMLVLATLSQAAPAVPPVDDGQTAWAPSLYGFSINYSDSKHRSSPEQAQMLRELGFNGIGYDLELWIDGNLDQHLSAFDKAGLKLYLLCVTVNVNPKHRTYDPRLPEIIRKLKGRPVTISVLFEGFPPADPRGTEPAVEILRQLGDLAAESGLRVSIYHHNTLWVESFLHALDVVKKVHHPQVGVNFNLCHWLRIDGQKDYRPVLRENAAKIFAVTLNGANLKSGAWVQPLDQGDFDNRELLATLRQIGYRGPIGLMCYGIPGDARDHLARSMKVWRSWQAAESPPDKTPKDIVIRLDGTKEGRTFEGIGALSAGASSRLLIDYPEPSRSQILDFLFKPNYGAALHHLKVEIGGDVNSTDGCEPSHMRTPSDENYRRGYEWWLMTEAKKRNPAVILDCLEWGTPAWIGGGTFYSQDNADYIVKFLRGAKTVHGLDIDYVGIWNEMPYDVPWIKLLRKTLDRNRLERVKIVAADEICRWTIVDKMKADPELAAAIHTVAVHYPKYDSTPAAKQCGKPLWASEDGPWKDTWAAAGTLAKMYNRNYISGRMTKTIIWSLVTSYYDNLPVPNSGLIEAMTPWSAYYKVLPHIWITAHTTQFTQPGWKYLDGDACGYLSAKGSYVTLKSPTGTDYSVILETVDAKRPQSVVLQLAGGLSTADVRVWRTSEKEHFVRLNDIKPVDAAFSIALEPGCVYTLSTTTGQHKGTASIAACSPFPMPYRDDFESYAPGATPKYLCDQGGCFEVARRADGKGMCLRQVVTTEGAHWDYFDAKKGKRVGWPNPTPETLAGNKAWSDYRVGVDVLLDNAGHATVFGRVAEHDGKQDLPCGYWLQVDRAGTWELRSDKALLASGKQPISADVWHRLEISFDGATIRSLLNGVLLAEVADTRYRCGMAGLGSGWNRAQFDNFAIDNVR
jgi:sugar phosphate isomerase/epimerase